MSRKNPKRKTPTRQKVLVDKISENIGNGKPVIMQKLMQEVGYSASYAKNSTLLKDTRSWDQLLKEEMPDSLLMNVHKDLLNANRLDHMVFPPLSTVKKEGKHLVDAKPENVITDEEIQIYLLELGCRVKKIVHGEQARHVYFWSPDNQARDKALDKGYKLKSKYAPEEFNLKFKGFTKEQLINMIANKVAKK